MTAKELREKRASLATRIKELADKSHKDPAGFAAETENWKNVNADYDALSAQIDIAERAEKVESEQRSAIKPGREDYDSRKALEDANREEREDGDLTDEELGLNVRNIDPNVLNHAVKGWMLYQSGEEVKDSHVRAAAKAGISLRKRELSFDLDRRALSQKEARALSVVDASLGSTTVAPSFSGAFERAMLAFGGMREVAQVLRTDTGANMPWPTANDTSNEGRIVGENIALTATDPSFGSVTWGAFKYTSDLIRVPVELLEDSAFDIASEVGRMCGERIARRQNRDFTVGTGAARPNGIVSAASLGKTAASATAITGDEILDLIHSVDPAYRNDPSFRLMFNDAVLLVIRKLKDSQNRYLFQDAVAGAAPTVHGVPYVINQHMSSSIAASEKTVIAGALSYYKIRDVRQIRFRRLVERYADSDQEGFVAFMRSDGNLLNAGVAPVKYLVQAAS